MNSSELAEKGRRETERVVEFLISRGGGASDELRDELWSKDEGAVSVLAVCAAHVLATLGAFRPTMGRLIDTPFTVVKAGERELWESVQVTAWALAYVLDRMGNQDTMARLSRRSIVHGGMVQGAVDQSLEKWGVLVG